MGRLDFLKNIFKKQEKTPEAWIEPPPPAEEEKPAEKGWSSAEAGRVPGHPKVKRALAGLLILLYAATMFLVPMDTYGSGLTLLTIYLLLDYMMITRG